MDVGKRGFALQMLGFDWKSGPTPHHVLATEVRGWRAWPRLGLRERAGCLHHFTSDSVTPLLSRETVHERR
jgi:hypothetical protein